MINPAPCHSRILWLVVDQIGSMVLVCPSRPCSWIKQVMWCHMDNSVTSLGQKGRHDVLHDVTEVISHSRGLTMVAKQLLWALSQQPSDRFCPFLASRMIWSYGQSMQEISIIRPIYESWDMFCWIMQRPFSFHGNECFKPDSALVPDLPAKFGAHRSINGWGVAGQTNPQTLLKF